MCVRCENRSYLELIEEEDARGRRRSAPEKVPHRQLTRPDILIQDLTQIEMEDTCYLGKKEMVVVLNEEDIYTPVTYLTTSYI